MLRLLPLLAALSMVAPARAESLDWQVHGFASQGFVQSEGNNFFGDSTNGSTGFFEAGINGSVQLLPGLMVAAQGVIRDAGATDSGKPRLDFGLVDYQFVRRADLDMGIRLGRVKNPLGLFNDTRDMVFTRPGILLPQSVYFEGLGLRSLTFSSDGGQLYGRYSFGAHDLSATVSGALARDLSKSELRPLTGGAPIPGDVHLDQYVLSQLRDDWSSGRGILALSHAHARLELDTSLPIEQRLEVNLFVLSGRYNAERFSLTGEYIQTRTRSYDSFSGSMRSISDGFYFQGDYRLTSQWSVFARYDATFSDIHDRDGSKAAATSGVEKWSRYAHDFGAGVNWRYDEHWGVWAEAHSIRGTATAPPLDNPDGSDDPNWHLFTVMVGYRF